MAIISEKIIKITISNGERKKRIDTFLANTLEYTSRSRIQKLIKDNLLTVNGNIVKANFIINPKDEIILRIPIQPRPDIVEPENIPIDIVFEDDYIIVINKAAGMVVHPSPGNYSGTLVHALKYHSENLSNANGGMRAGIVHRIDKDTSGLLLIVKDEKVHSHLAKQFADHSIEREYWAVCWGKMKEPKGEIIGNIARSKKDRKIFAVSETGGKHAHTFYEVLEEYDFLSLLKLNLKTGRTHQIRVHLSHNNHSIFGDHTYGGRRINYGFQFPKIKQRVENLLTLINRQALHAKTLGFIHPVTKEKMLFNSELPEDFSNLLKEVRGELN
ncbi:MAG: RNA pseudouridine synthase [Ignavibacteriae bacterium]|nr:MAG: RNA pseudouridine synthase [Ignavibacteriota bacterium]